VLELQRRLPDSELGCELTNLTWVEGFRGKKVLHGGKSSQAGVHAHLSELENFSGSPVYRPLPISWGAGIRQSGIRQTCCFYQRQKNKARTPRSQNMLT